MIGIQTLAILAVLVPSCIQAKNNAKHALLDVLLAATTNKNHRLNANLANHPLFWIANSQSVEYNAIRPLILTMKG